MPLVPGDSRAAKAANYRELQKTGRPKKQIIAIMLSEARRTKKIGARKK